MKNSGNPCVTEKDDYISGDTMLFMERLLNGRFSELFPPEELRSFNQFLGGTARNAGGFALAFPTTDLHMVWVHYKIDQALSNPSQVVIDLAPKIHMTKGASKPEELAEVPVWWHIEEGSIRGFC